MVDVCLSVIDDFKVGPATYFLLWQLAVHPFEHLLPADAVALHDALDANLFGSRNDDDLIH